ncbi:hypothetical protein [Yersinia phage vB_YenM_P778]
MLSKIASGLCLNLLALTHWAATPQFVDLGVESKDTFTVGKRKTTGVRKSQRAAKKRRKSK